MMNKLANLVIGLLLISGLLLIGFVGYKKFKSSHKKASLKKTHAPIVQVMTESAPTAPLDPFTVEELKKIVRLDPEKIPGMPKSLQFILKREKCDVVEQNKRAVWIKGSFYKKGQVDYAALCITPLNEMTIKVLWGNEKPCPISLAYGQADKYVVLSKAGPLKFSRTLGLANTKRVQYFIKKENLSLTGEVPEGIEDIVIDKKSKLHVCDGTKWVSLDTK